MKGGWHYGNYHYCFPIISKLVRGQTVQLSNVALIPDDQLFNESKNMDCCVQFTKPTAEKHGVAALQTTNSQRLAEAAQINHALKNLESNDQRMEFLSDCFAGICRHCGEVTESCYCMRDD